MSKCDEKSVREWCKQNGYLLIRESVYEQEITKAYFEGQNANTCDVCVSKQEVNDLVDELARAISDERCCISRGRSTATIMRDIIHLPPVTPKHKTIHWIKINKKGKK